jgi:glycosyltransferase involved in cell wall biosynthesis
MQISVITPSFNQCEFLRQTLTSVLGQRGDFQLDHWVIDGGSSDGTIDLLKNNGDPRLHWSSQPDNGQSDAINRGMRQVSGDIIGWLNSDDLYVPGALSAVAAAFSNPNVQWVVGRYQIINAAGLPVRSLIARYKDRALNHYSCSKLLRENFIAQPAVFWRREFGQKIGPLDESLHYTMDYDLWLRMGKASEPLILNQILSQFRIHPRSKSGAVNREQFDEGYRVACRYLEGDRLNRWWHRLNVEKIVWAYRLMQWLGK